MPTQDAPNITSCNDLNDLPKKIFIKSELELNQAAFMYFKHPKTDSCIRVWFWEHRSFDSGGYYKVNLFEYGILSHSLKDRKSMADTGFNSRFYAVYSSFEITGRGDNDAGWLVTCVKTRLLKPASGWVTFNNLFLSQKLNKIYLMPDGQSSGPTGSSNCLDLEYILPKGKIKLGYSGAVNIYRSTFPRDIAFLKLVDLVSKEFNIEIGYAELPGYKEYIFDTGVQSVVIDTSKF
jgi:hypothetical protein